MTTPRPPALDAPDDDRTAYAEWLDTRVIWRSEVGSTAHGVGHASNDIDEIAVYVPPIEHLTMMHRPAEHYVYRPGRKPHEPSGPGDLDRTYYSVRKFIGLLERGNPSILYSLFGTERFRMVHFGDVLLQLRGRYVNDLTRKAYLGYMQRQRERITGERGAAGRMRRSPEGGGEIDWKYAMHMVRLGIQGLEYLTTGHISSPSLRLDDLQTIRAGESDLDYVLDQVDWYEREIKSLDLPTSGSIEYADKASRTLHVAFWKTVDGV